MTQTVKPTSALIDGVDANRRSRSMAVTTATTHHAATHTLAHVTVRTHAAHDSELSKASRSRSRTTSTHPGGRPPSQDDTSTAGEVVRKCMHAQPGFSRLRSAVVGD